ncbi:MAG: hypothetical protein Q9160_005106 [Pyrenula sp. 1 TL-2023]
MKATFITLLALTASPAFALVARGSASGGTRFAGSLAARAAHRGQGYDGNWDNRWQEGDDQRWKGRGKGKGKGGDVTQGNVNMDPAAPATTSTPATTGAGAATFCKVDPSTLGNQLAGNPAMPADLDGMELYILTGLYLANPTRRLHYPERLHDRPRSSSCQWLFKWRTMLHQIRLCWCK